MLVSWVDDYYVICNDDSFYKEFLRKMKKEFDVNDLGTPKHVLQATVSQKNKNTIEISQERAINDYLEKFGMKDCNPSDMVLPVSANNLTRGTGTPPKELPYLSL